MTRRLGARFAENMYGTYTRPGEEERPFMFHAAASTADLWRSLRDGHLEMEGWVEAEGLARHAPIHGFMIAKPLGARFIRYEFDFRADDGARYRYAGQKTIRHLHPMRTWTTLVGAIHDAEGREIARSVTRFRMRELLSFLGTFRPTLVAPAPHTAEA